MTPTTTTAATTPTKAQVDAHRAWLTLEAYDHQVTEARARVAALEADRHQGAAAAERAAAPLADYYRAVSAGERGPDGELERELRDQAREGRDGLVIRPRSPLGGGPSIVDVIDERVEAELEGARQALERAERRLATHEYAASEALAVELWPATTAARDRFDEAWGEVQAAEREWLDLLARWARLARIRGVPADQFPASPLRGVGPTIGQGVPLPMAPAMIPDGEEG